MARVIKKISDLEMLEGLTSTSNVIVEEGGEAKLFPAANIGSVKTVNGIEPDENGNIEVEIPDVEIPEINYPVTSVNGQTGDVVIEVSSGSSVQADMAQNDPEQPDYVKNRTHWVEGSGATIEWDGNTEGRDSFEIDGAIFYKVSDKVASYDDLIGGEFSLTEQQELFNGTLSEGDIEEGTNCYFFADGGMAIVLQPEFEIAGITLSAPSAGIYFGYADAGTYATKLSYGNLVVHKLDPKFMPKPEDFIISFSFDVDTFTVTTFNRSFEEIVEAYQDGKNILFETATGPVTFVHEKPTIQYWVLNGEIVRFFFSLVRSHDDHIVDIYVYVTDDGSTAVDVKVTFTDNGEPRISAISDVTAAPTMEDFNALLAALRNSGLMATE